MTLFSKLRKKTRKNPLSTGPVHGAVFVLGMHRSGTSWFTGALQQAGLFLGKHHTWNPHNRKGNRENPDVYALHESILEHNGASWDRPPQGRMEWTQEHRNNATRIINGTAGLGVWGMKDPRTLLVLDGWKDLLSDLRFVGIFRHPISVWASLNARSKIEKDDALSMWVQYNRRLLDECDKKPFPLLCFDWDEQVLRERFFKVCEELNLSQDRHKQDFFSKELRHQTQICRENLPKRVMQIYQHLHDLSEERTD